MKSHPLDIDTLTREEEDALIDEARRRFGTYFKFTTLEDLLVSPDGFNLTTATPLQRACCRIVQGTPLGELADEEAVKRALGYGDCPDFQKAPSEVVILAGVRTAKSMLAAALAIWASQKIDVGNLGRGEIPRFSILSLSLDNARVVLGHLLGALQQPAIAPLRVSSKSANSWKDLIDEAGADVIGSEFLWHPSSRPVEIRVVAGKRSGGSLVSRWSAGCVFDEAPRMVGASEAVVNYDDAWRAVRPRLLPGAQILSVGSPWQPYGPIYDLVQSDWGNPTESRVVLKATGPSMNPVWWNPDRCEEVRISDPKVFRTDVLAEFADASEALIPQDVLKEATRKDRVAIPFERGHDYSAAMDPATRGNAWTLVIADRVGRKKRIVRACEWQGSTLDPLSPRKVLEECAEILDEYGLDWCYTDQWAADANRDIGQEIRLADVGRPDYHGLHLVIEDWSQTEKTNAYLSFAVAMADGTIELPNVPNLQKDLKLLQKKPTQRGVSIHLPPTPDGRHCDFAPATVRALIRWIEDEIPDVPEYGTEAHWNKWEEDMIAEEEAQLQEEEAKEWWEQDPYSENYNSELEYF